MRIRIAALVGISLISMAHPCHADDEALKPIDLSVEVQAPLDRAWKLWTTNEGLQSFLASKAVIELKPEGRLEVWFAPDAPAGQRGAEGLKVLAYLPQEMLAFEWNAPPKYPKARAKTTFVVLRFEALPGGKTRLRLTQRGFVERAAEAPDDLEEWKGTRVYLGAAWPRVLAAFQKAVEQ